MASIQQTVTGLDEAIAKFGALAEVKPEEVADQIGALVVMQTQARISSEKASPTGEAWKPNMRGTSILFQSGGLNSSIHHLVMGNKTQIGSGLVYARIHNDGGEIRPKKGKALKYPGRAKQDMRVQSVVRIPKRQYLGISPANAQEIEAEIGKHYLGKMQ